MSGLISAQIRKAGDTPLKVLIRNLGGWPVLDENWETPKTSLEQMLAKIRGKYNEAILVAVVVGPDDKNSSANILQVIFNCKVG